MKEQADQARKYSKFADQLREAAQEVPEAARREVLLTMADDYELMAAESFGQCEDIGPQMDSNESSIRS